MKSRAARRMLRLCILLHSIVYSNSLDINFDEPRRGAVCYRASVGEVLNFHWNEYHNLHLLPHRAAYDSCDFGTAEQIVGAGPQPNGVQVTVSSTTAQYFACSKICSSNDHKVMICVNDTLCDSCRGERRPSPPSPPSPPDSDMQDIDSSTDRHDPPSTPKQSQEESSENVGLAPGHVAAIVAGTVCGVALALASIAYCCRAASIQPCPPPRKV